MFKLYSVYDSVSKEFASPVMMKNDDVAKRWFFNQFLSQVDKAVVKDLSCYCVGEFSTETASIVPYKEIYCIDELEDSDETTKEIMNG